MLLAPDSDTIGVPQQILRVIRPSFPHFQLSSFVHGEQWTNRSPIPYTCTHAWPVKNILILKRPGNLVVLHRPLVTVPTGSSYTQPTKCDVSSVLKFPRIQKKSCSSVSMNDLSVLQKRDEGWYLSFMAPNTKGPKFAWLDPSRLYCNSQALSDCVKDLLKPFKSDSIDLVAGIDAMGFILGSAVATTLGKGFLVIRKAGHLCVQTQTQEYTDYSGRDKLLEVRVDVLKPGLRVLIVDQWIETGGTMKAAIKLVEKQGASVVGVAAVAIENSKGGKWIKENYKHSHCIPEKLQSQIDRHYLQSFKNFNS